MALMLAMAMITAGCHGSDEKVPEVNRSTARATLTTDMLERVGVEQSDLPSGYNRQPDSGQKGGPECLKIISETRASASFATQLQNFGLRGCSTVAYSKEVKAHGDTSNNSPGSFAFLFADEDSASKALPATRAFLKGTFRPSGDFGEPVVVDLPVSGLGDEALPGVKFTTDAKGLVTIVFALYVWRVRNVVIGVGGCDALSDMTEQTIFDMAKKIDFRATH
ncbi:MAG: hypothetical protein M3011_11355 [Actinomycetota bacterium]|nr:hypothetical protein [Actinomycetota bacterium]